MDIAAGTVEARWRCEISFAANNDSCLYIVKLIYL